MGVLTFGQAGDPEPLALVLRWEPWETRPVSHDSSPQRGSPISARGNAPGSHAHQRHEP